jgi:serine/threonine protein kinase/Flp pilus assembly protein TadD
MGVTYKAFDLRLERPVALKIIQGRFIGDQAAQQRFLREARAAASVRHPNVASVFHLGKAGIDYFYAMEFVEGETLERLIKRSGQLKPDLALEITRQIAAGLSAIDKQNLVHRDVKPGNIIVNLEEGRPETVKIIDLGLAKGIAEEGNVSTTGTFAGTPEYASPEQFVGVGVDIRSDLYSLGITFWEMLTGDVPFKGTNSELIYQHQHTPPPVRKLAHFPQPLIPLLELVLEKDPARRFQTPNRLLAAISTVSEALRTGGHLTKDELKSAVTNRGSSRLIEDQSPGVVSTVSSKNKSALRWSAVLVLSTVLLLGALLLFYNHRNLTANEPTNQMAPPEKSIAVLPFESLSRNKDDTYFADGVQDEILNDLAKVAQLTVISRTSVMLYRADEKRDLRQIANALGVANVLEGTVRRNANRVRISTELVDALQDKTIWADSFDRDLTDIFAVQGEVAKTIATKLAATLSPEEKRNIEKKPTENLDAYDLYLRAKELINRADVANILGDAKKPFEDAIHLLDQAVQLDPKFTLAYCRSAYAHDQLYLSDPTPEQSALADASVSRALALEPDLPEVHLIYAFNIYRVHRDYERAREQLSIARRGLPNDAEAIALEAYLDRRQGQWERAIQEFRDAITRDPRNSSFVEDLALTFSQTHHYRAAEQMFDRLIGLNPDDPLVKAAKGLLVNYLETGDDSAVWTAIEAFPASMADDRRVLSMRLSLALIDRDWVQAKELIKKMNGGYDEGDFAFVEGTSVPVGCYSLLLARLQGEETGANASFAGAREQLNEKVQKDPGNAGLLSQLAVVDALLNNKETAIAEAKRAAEMLPISQDAVDGGFIELNQAAVYAWTGELDLAFETLSSLAKSPGGLYYGQLKCEPYWQPLRQDPRYEQLLAELAPKG